MPEKVVRYSREVAEGVNDCNIKLNGIGDGKIVNRSKLFE